MQRRIRTVKKTVDYNGRTYRVRETRPRVEPGRLKGAVLAIAPVTFLGLLILGGTFLAVGY